MLDRIQDHRNDGAPAVILDVPLLAEGGLDNVCDLVVFVDTPIDIRVRRAQETRGWDADEVSRREAHQLPTEEKCSRASAVIDNGGTRENTREQTETFWNEQVVPKIEDEKTN